MFAFKRTSFAVLIVCVEVGLIDWCTKTLLFRLVKKQVLLKGGPKVQIDVAHTRYLKRVSFLVRGFADHRVVAYLAGYQKYSSWSEAVTSAPPLMLTFTDLMSLSSEAAPKSGWKKWLPTKSSWWVW